MYDEYDDRDFYYSSDDDWDRANAFEMGADRPNQAWILTDRDVWHPNPFYKGPEMPHPESQEYINMLDEEYLDYIVEEYQKEPYQEPYSVDGSDDILF